MLIVTYNIAQKMKFPADLVLFTEEILNGKHFLLRWCRARDLIFSCSRSFFIQ